MPGSNGNTTITEVIQDQTSGSNSALGSSPTVTQKSPFYQTNYYTRQTFDKDAQLAKMYGTQASKRDRRRFEKYWNSDQRLADEKAFNDAEIAKETAHNDAEYARYKASVDNWMRDRELARQQLRDSYYNKPSVTTPASTTTPATPEAAPQDTPPAAVLQPRTDWNAQAKQYGFADMNAVAQWQRENGLVADGKFGKNSLAKFNELQAQNAKPAGKSVMKDVMDDIPVMGTLVAGRDFWSNPSKQTAKALGKRIFWDIASGNPVVRAGRVAKGLWDGAVGLWNKLPDFQNGGTISRYAAGGSAPQQDTQKQVIALVQAAMQGDQKATQTVNQIMEAAKAGNQQAMQLAQMIQAVAQKMQGAQEMQGQATTAKWGAKLSYIKSLKYAQGGKTCPACDKGSKVKVVYKDIDKETYKKLPTDKQHAASMHAEHYASEYHKNGTYKTVHKPTAEDSTTIDKKHLSVNMKKKYTDKKECGGKAKKHYFGGWL